MILNVPYWVFIIVYYASKEPIKWLMTDGQYIALFLSRTSILLNAAINPIIYFTRMKEIREMRAICYPSQATPSGITMSQYGRVERMSSLRVQESSLTVLKNTISNGAESLSRGLSRLSVTNSRPVETENVEEKAGSKDDISVNSYKNAIRAGSIVVEDQNNIK